jgi:hypothetical protein
VGSAAKEQVLRVVVDAMVPLVGATMAQASVRGVCERLALSDGQISREQMRKLLEELTPGLHVFIGRAKAESLLASIWWKLDALEGMK